MTSSGMRAMARGGAGRSGRSIHGNGRVLAIMVIFGFILFTLAGC